MRTSVVLLEKTSSSSCPAFCTHTVAHQVLPSKGVRWQPSPQLLKHIKWNAYMEVHRRVSGPNLSQYLSLYKVRMKHDAT